MVTNNDKEQGIYAAMKSIAAQRTRYFVEVRTLQGRIVEREFESMLERTIFVIGIEANGLGTVLREWMA